MTNFILLQVTRYDNEFKLYLHLTIAFAPDFRDPHTALTYLIQKM